MKELDLLKFYPKSTRKFYFKKRRKLSGGGFINLDRNHFNDRDLLIEYSMISRAREFGYEYFDGDRMYGYGGYFYKKKYWHKTAKHIIDHYGLESGMTILDIGCAKGYLLYEIKKINPEILISGIDISNYAIENAKEEVVPYLIQGSAHDLPYESNIFDLVISINTIDHLDLKYCEKSIHEIERVKKTNAKSFYDNPPKYWKKTDYKRSIKESVLEEGIFKTKSLYLTFPKPGWETIGGYLMKALGIVTGVFTNAQEAIDVVRKKENRIDPPLNELVIGSHGDGQQLLMGGGSEGLPVNDLLREVKGFVGSDTTVFFTACYGADFLKQLCLASSELNGHRVYGAAGIYNYISNTAQKGFYSCQMSPRQHNEFYNDSEKFNIVFGSDKSNDYLINKGFCKRESNAPINWVKNIWT